MKTVLLVILAFELLTLFAPVPVWLKIVAVVIAIIDLLLYLAFLGIDQDKRKERVRKALNTPPTIRMNKE